MHAVDWKVTLIEQELQVLFLEMSPNQSSVELNAVLRFC